MAGVGDDGLFGRATDKVYDEDTQGSGSGSGYSDLSALENETDEFGRIVLKQHRDAQRLKALQRNPQAFRKARPRPRVAETLEREEREREQRLQGGQDHKRPGSGESNNELEPPVTVPREWGRRARKQTDWMRKILEPSEPSEDDIVGEEVPTPDELAIMPRRTGYTGDLDWSPTGDPPLHSLQTTPPSMRRHRGSDSPSSLHHMNTTLRPDVSAEEGEFSAVSLLASTPAVTRLPRKIDELTRREIQRVEREAVATRALEQLDQRSPNSTLRRTSSTRLRERAIALGMDSPSRLPRPPSSPEKPRSPTRMPRRRANKENLPPGSEVNGDTRKSDEVAVGLTSRASHETNLQGSTTTTHQQRPKHDRNDSMTLLRKLARVSSVSPSPLPEKRTVDVMAREKGENTKWETTTNGRVLSGEFAYTDNVASSRPTMRSTRTGGWGWGFEALKSERAMTAERTGHDVEASSGHTDDEANATPVRRDHHTDLKTPVVTGAWIDTTLATDSHALEEAKQTNGTTTMAPHANQQATSSKDQAEKDGLRRVKTEPAHPKSALEAILRESRAQPQDQLFGDSTIQSLEELAHPNLEPTDPTITFDLGKMVIENNHLDPGITLTQHEKDRRQEDLAMEGLNKHLRNARTSIKDASRGLRRVENRIETTQEGVAAAASNPSTTITVSKSATGQHGYIPCETCGGGYHSVWYALWTEFRSLFYVYTARKRDAHLFGIRFTWLGLACLVWLAWYLTESALCWHWCKPDWVYKGQTYKMPPEATRWPFTIPTLISRVLPFKWLWEPAWEFVVQWAEVWFEEHLAEVHRDPRLALVHGPSLGVHPQRTFRRAFEQTVVAGRGEWVATATTTGVRVAKSVVDAVDEVGRMWEDEYLS